MGKKVYTTDVDIMLRAGDVVSGPVAGFQFDYTEDAIEFAGMTITKLGVTLLGHEDVRGVSLTHTMRDYINVYVEVTGSAWFDEVWPIIVNACRVFQVFDQKASASNVVEFPYGY